MTGLKPVLLLLMEAPRGLAYTTPNPHVLLYTQSRRQQGVEDLFQLEGKLFNSLNSCYSILGVNF